MRRSRTNAANAAAANYFDARTVNRQRLLWAVATRRQLERWEALVVAGLRAESGGPPLDDAAWWSGEIEHHLALVAARNLLHALDLPPTSTVSIDPTLRAELEEGRNLHEHWTDNMPLFNVTPRPAQPRPRKSGRDYAARNEKGTPYDWLRWNGKIGAQLLPNVSASALHELLDAVEAEVLNEYPELGRFVPERAPSLWVHLDGEWWPKTEP
jgi:hypothetical protein